MPAPALLKDLFKFLMARPETKGRQMVSFLCRNALHCGEGKKLCAEVRSSVLSLDPGSLPQYIHIIAWCC